MIDEQELDPIDPMPLPRIDAGGPAAALPRRQSTRDRDLSIDRARRQAFGASKPPQNPDPDDIISRRKFGVYVLKKVTR